MSCHKNCNRYFAFQLRLQQTLNLINRPDGLIVCPLWQDYVDYVRKLVEKYPEHESENSVTTAAHGKEEGFSYSSPSLSSSPVSAVKSAATVFGGDSSTSASATSFSGAGLFGARTGTVHHGSLYTHFNSKLGQSSEGRHEVTD